MSDPALDLEVIERLRSLNQPGAPDVVREVLTLFLEETPARLAAITAAAESGDADALRRAAHVLKGSAAAIGAVTLQRICAGLEDAAQQGRMVDAPTGAESASVAYTAVRAAIDHLL
ncbi:MAG: Hpt domain-containing protein [Planctomycetota bacterium]|nr:Hpt domain-containing protein [Planctomycetota bacterium]